MTRATGEYLKEAVRRAVDGSPPLTPDQIARLRILLAPAVQAVEDKQSINPSSARRRKIRFIRGSRNIPTLKRIANFHGIDTKKPFCTHCGERVPAESWEEAGPYLDRCHMIDRTLNGLDGPQNLAPQCPNCHRKQPSFAPGDELKALAWFAYLPECNYTYDQ